jgi:hypothetical protein
MHVSSLAAAISDSFISRLWQNWRRLCQGRVPFCRSPSYPGGSFQKAEKKEATARPHLDAAARQGKDRVVLIGVAQEKASIWKSWPRKGQEKAPHPHMDWGREQAYVNHFYFYLWDAEWGAAFWKTNAYAPFAI